MSTRQPRSHFVRDSFQLRFFMVSLLHYLIVILTFIGALFLPLMLQLDSLDLALPDRVNLANQFLSLHERVWPALLVAMALLGLHVLFFSHRVAGPLYRWRSIFKAIGSGDLTIKATVRKGDYLQREVELLNDMIGQLRTRVAEIERLHGELRQVSDQLRHTIARDAAGELASCANLLEERVEGLGNSLKAFKTTAS